MLCFVFAVLVALLDQFFKRWIILTLALEESRDLIPGVIELTHIENPGAAFSILAGQRWLLAGIAFVAVLLLIAILLRYNEGFWGTLGLSAVLGGAVGNLIDRVAYGAVIDMFNLQFMHFAIFNIADIFITLGGIIFLIHFIVTSIRPPASKKAVYDRDLSGGPLSEAPPVEDEIGLYDFQYGEETNDRDSPEYYDDSDVRIAPDRHSVSASSQPLNNPETVADVGALDLPELNSPGFDALSELESELLEADALEDYDLDELLREYGFEDDADKM